MQRRTDSNSIHQHSLIIGMAHKIICPMVHQGQQSQQKKKKKNLKQVVDNKN
jgi:hypothetical protein